MKVRNILIIALLSSLSLSVTAQEQPKDAKQREKEFYEAIQKEVEKQTLSLSLEYWQEFRVDSMLTHDYTEMQKELDALSKSKVSNTDLYYRVQDKWSEQIYSGYKSILSSEQWEQYLKKGAAREKKNRDKRMSKYQEL